MDRRCFGRRVVTLAVAGAASLRKEAGAGTRQRRQAQVVIDLDDPRFAALGEVGGAMKVAPEGSYQPVIVVRLSEDELIAFSSACPHWGCEVSLPDEEGLIACSCHESYFDREGRYLEGPAEADLPRVKLILEAGTAVRRRSWGRVKDGSRRG